MKRLMLATLALCLCSCAVSKETAQPDSKSSIGHPIRARITYYTADGKYGTKVAWSKIKNAIYGQSVAAHPDFAFGTKVYIPKLKDQIGDGYFVVHDRGSAVTKKTAACGKGYVFDVYVKTNAEVTNMARKMPEWVDVYILK